MVMHCMAACIMHTLPSLGHLASQVVYINTRLLPHICRPQLLPSKMSLYCLVPHVHVHISTCWNGLTSNLNP
ncbi:hypothetical protein F5148DRAFT_743686 [Russula earlei]|uniref:Uncharacterized protein n=1 Tax=Russula earlei TaxID=71964 RepID=A0ACC0TTU6_9AGAM|nr:hypothetical protein F5148DRAFT_743686 [Russula earlei]